MIALIIDTSTEPAFIALAKNERLLAYQEFSENRSLSKTLLPALAQFVSEQKIPLSEIDFLAVGIGPGSYTGTRIGATVAATLAFSLQIPIVEFCSLLAFIPPLEGSFAALFPAKSGHTFLLTGQKQKDNFTGPMQQCFVTEEELSDRVKGIDHIISSPSLHLPPLIPFVFNIFHHHPDQLKTEPTLIYLNSLAPEPAPACAPG